MGLEIVGRCPSVVGQNHDKFTGGGGQRRIDTEAVIVEAALTLRTDVDELKSHTGTIETLSYRSTPFFVEFIRNNHLEVPLECLPFHRIPEHIETAESGRS